MIEIADIDITATVTRANLSPPGSELDLNDGVKFIFAKGLRIGTVTWRRETVNSPFVEGRVPVHEIKDAAESTVIVYCLGATHAALNNNIAELLEAFTEQYTYELRMTVGGVNHRWACERADYEVAFATETLNALFVPVSLTMHRKPTPVAGAF